MNVHPLVAENLRLVAKCHGEGITHAEAARMHELIALRKAAFAEALAELVNYHRAVYYSACCDSSEIELSQHTERWEPYVAKDFLK